MNKWKKEKFNRMVKNDKTRIYEMTETQGYTFGNFGVHKNYGWIVTHLPTGYTIYSRFSFDTLKQAKEVIEFAESFFDWSIPQEQIVKNEQMKEFAQNPIKFIKKINRNYVGM